MANLLISPGRVTTVTLNRPHVRNALDDVVIGELSEWASTLSRDGSVRAVVLKGNGPVFCAGADLNWMTRIAGYTLEENLEDARRAARLFHLLDSLPVPVIARVHGAALGGGAGLVAVSDIVVSADDAVFGFTETTLGIVPAMIAPYVLRKIGMSQARRLCLSGVRFPAADARAIGLVHDVVPGTRLDATVDGYLAELDRAGPSAVAATKRLLREIAGRPAGDVLALTVDVIARQRVSTEGQEGMRAFLGKRAPEWAGSGVAKRPARPARRKARHRP